MSLDTGLSELIKRIYSAAGDPAVWDEIIVEIFQRVRCCAGISVLLELPQLHLVKCRIYGPPHVGYCVEEYSARYKLNPTLIWASKNRDKRFCDSRAALEPAEYQSHPFVTWAAETFGASFWITGFTAPTRGAHFCLSPFFPDDSEDRSEDLKLFRLLFDHVECALRLRNKPFSEESARALIRLSDEGAVENTSRGARRMLEQQSAIYICNDRLCSAGYLQQNIIDRTVEKIITSEDALRRPTAVQIKHDRGRPCDSAGSRSRRTGRTKRSIARNAEPFDSSFGMSAMGGKLPLALAPQNIPSRTIVAGESVGRPIRIRKNSYLSR